MSHPSQKDDQPSRKQRSRRHIIEMSEVLTLMGYDVSLIRAAQAEEEKKKLENPPEKPCASESVGETTGGSQECTP